MTGIETALIVTAVASAAFSAFSAIQQGQQAKAASNYNAQVMENQAQAAKNEAAYQERLQRQRSARQLSAIKAGYGASGVESGSGSPLEVLSDSAEQAELDALAIRYSGTAEEARLKSQAALDRFRGSAAASAGYISAGGSLLSGASRVAGSLNSGSTATSTVRRSGEGIGDPGS